MKSKRRQYMEIIKNKQFDEERALYNSKNVTIDHCLFAGIRDGESVLKESRNIEVFNSSFSLRYPLWHVDTFVLKDSSFDEKTRAAIWYSKFGKIDQTKLFGIKAIRECQNIQIKNCQIQSNEFGWKSKDIELIDSSIESEYLFLDSKDVFVKNIQMKGKYSFQYMENLLIENSILDTKDVFWHSKNVIVNDSTIKGKIESIKNPKSGFIKADSIGHIIKENSIMEDTCKIETKF